MNSKERALSIKITIHVINGRTIGERHHHNPSYLPRGFISVIVLNTGFNAYIVIYFKPKKDETMVKCSSSKESALTKQTAGSLGTIVQERAIFPPHQSRSRTQTNCIVRCKFQKKGLLKTVEAFMLKVGIQCF